jgi:hypothetical protein
MPDDKKPALNRLEKPNTEQSSSELGSFKPEKLNSVESGPATLIESSPEHREKEDVAAEMIENKSDEKNERGSGTGGGAIVSASAAYQARQKKIEEVLESDLKDIYLSLSPEERSEFKITGEQTANMINNLIETGKAKIGKIISLIREWLSLIPGVNRFFLEQEAKIKADEILRLKR